MKNKKGDIPVMILVIAVIALLILALFSFYLVNEKQKREGLDSFYHLQRIYNVVESIKYSKSNDPELEDKYEIEGSEINRKVKGLEISYNFE